jgi:hypothetical protein
MHRVRVKHTNNDAFSCNLVDVFDEREEEIQDYKLVGPNFTLAKTIWIGQRSLKLGVKLQ